LDQNTIGTAVGVAGLVLAGYSHYRAVLVDRAKTKLEDIVSIRLSDIGRSVKDAQDNAGLAYDHFDLIRQYVSGQPSTKEQLEVIDHLSWAQADVVATHRMLKRLLSDVCSIYTAMYKKKLDLHDAEDK